MANFLCQIPLQTAYLSPGLYFFFYSACPRQVFASLLDHKRAIILPLSMEGNGCHPVSFGPFEVCWRQQAFGKNENEVATSYHVFMRLLSNASEVFQYCWLLQLKCQNRWRAANILTLICFSVYYIYICRIFLFTSCCGCRICSKILKSIIVHYTLFSHKLIPACFTVILLLVSLSYTL